MNAADPSVPQSPSPPVPQLPSHPVTQSSHTALKLTFPGSNPDVRIEPFDRLTTTVSYFLGNDPADWHADVPVWGGVRYADLYPGVDLVVGERNAFWQLQTEPGAAYSAVHLRVEGADAVAMENGALVLTTAVGEIRLSMPGGDIAVQVDGLTSGGQRKHLQAASPGFPIDDPTDLIYSTFLGSAFEDQGNGIAVTDQGRTCVAGHTWSADFPSTPGAFDPSFNGGTDAFVACLSPDGTSLDLATFLGGSDYELCYALALDRLNRMVVAGRTTSDDFPTSPNTLDPDYNGEGDGFVVRLDATGANLEYATYLGGAGGEAVFGLAVDALSHAFVTGATYSADFPVTTVAFDTSYNGGDDLFVARLSTDGRALDYATFVGGFDADSSGAIAVDSAGRAYVAGSTGSTDFPTTPGSFDTSPNGDNDAFALRLNADGSALDYATLLGGNDFDGCSGIATDSLGRAYVTGQTGSGDFPTTAGAFDTTYNGGFDAYVARLDANASVLGYATFLGGTGGEHTSGIVVDGSGRAIVVGATWGENFPTTDGAFDTSPNGGGYDSFVSTFNAAGSVLEYSTFLGGNAQDFGESIEENGRGLVYIVGNTRSADFPTTPGAFDPQFGGSSDAFVAKLDVRPRYRPHMKFVIEQPGAGNLVSNAVTLSGYAIDLNSSTDTGVDRVHLYLDGQYGTGTFIGEAIYGIERPDVAAQYGTRFRPSGWALVWNTDGILAGAHEIVMYAHRTTDGQWTMPLVWPVIVGRDRVWLPIVRTGAEGSRCVDCRWRIVPHASSQRDVVLARVDCASSSPVFRLALTQNAGW